MPGLLLTILDKGIRDGYSPAPPGNMTGWPVPGEVVEVARSGQFPQVFTAEIIFKPGYLSKTPLQIRRMACKPVSAANPHIEPAKDGYFKYGFNISGDGGLG